MRIAIALVVLSLAGSAVAKDLVIRQRSSTGMPGTAPREETVYFSGGKVVKDSATDRTIVDLDAKTITAADKTKRTYTKVTFDELGAQMESFRKQLDTLPPEEKKKMSALFEEGPPVTVTPTGKTDTIAGYRAAEYTLMGGPYNGTVWTTEAIPTPPEFKRWKSIEQSSGASRGPGRQLSAAFEKLTGFPLRTHIETKTAGQSFLVSSEVLEITEASPPAEILSVPSGFTVQARPAPAP